MMKDPIETFIREAYQRNFEWLRMEGLGSLGPEVREVGLNQILLYWRKLRAVAEGVTDSEVPIHLPNQTTPQGRSFSIQGVVDIVREGDQTFMYDIKTHDPDFVRSHFELYEGQLNLYAYVWHQLRGEPLDAMYIIATAYPQELQDFLMSCDLNHLSPEEESRLQKMLDAWHPQIPIELNQDKVDEAIRRFGEVVDQIESRQFAPPGQDVLKSQLSQDGAPFASRVCSGCDARFSCSSYRAYAQQERGQWRMDRFVETFVEASDIAPESAEGWLSARLNDPDSRTDAYLDALLGE